MGGRRLAHAGPALAGRDESFDLSSLYRYSTEDRSGHRKDLSISGNWMRECLE